MPLRTTSTELDVLAVLVPRVLLIPSSLTRTARLRHSLSRFLPRLSRTSLLSSRPWSGPDLAEVDVAADVVEAEATAMAAAEVEEDICLVAEAEVATDEEEEEASAEAAVAAVVDSKRCCTTTRTSSLLSRVDLS